VCGDLDGSWLDHIQGMTVLKSQEAVERSTTTLTGCLIDQAALLGVLNNLYNLATPPQELTWEPHTPISDWILEGRVSWLGIDEYD